MDDNPTILILEEEDIVIPSYGSDEAAGADVYAHLAEPIAILPGSSALIPTGLRVEIPFGYEIQVRPRSGLALKHQITVLNTPGTIDSDYRGEVGVILINHGTKPFLVEPKMRIAQLVVAKVVRARYAFVSKLGATSRGGQGFGHTGV